MKRSSGPGKRPSNLSESVHHQLNMYALAASAAGVGLLALLSPAEAKIVYTPADVNSSWYFYKLDPNHDGIADFVLNSFPIFHYSTFVKVPAIYSAPSPNAVMGKSHLAAVWPGEEIGPKRKFYPSTGAYT